MRIFERIEGEVAFVFHCDIAAVVRNERMRKFMQAKGEHPADKYNKKGHFSYPFGFDLCHSHALERISCMLVWIGFQPSSLMILLGDATRRGESPGLRGASTVGIAWPVTFRAVSITSRAEKPFPLPTL